MERPPEHLIEAQRAAIADAVNARPFVGHLAPMQALVDEYRDASAVFQAKVAHLSTKYRGVRYVRGDGNCFVRGAVFGLLRHLSTCADARPALLATLRGASARATAQGYDAIVVEDFFDVLVEEAERCAAGITEDALLERMHDPETSDYLVMALRFFLATVMLEQQDTFLSFLPGAASMRDYVRAEVRITAISGCTLFAHPAQIEPMGKESEELSLIAFSHLGVAFALEYLDQSGADAQQHATTNSHVFQPPNGDGTLPLAFTMLFRPGHFDLLE